MSPNAAQKEYLENLQKIKSMADYCFDHIEGADQQLEFIQEQSGKIYQLQQRNNALLRETFYDKDPETISEREADQWFAFAKVLVDDYKQSDLGLAYDLHSRLLRRARVQGPREHIVRELYYCGLTLHYLDTSLNLCNANLYNDQVRDYFTEGASFLPEFELFDSETRAYILRCLGNIHLGYAHTIETPESFERYENAGTYQDHLDAFEWAYRVMTDEHYRKIDPTLPWDDYIYAMHFSRTTLLSQVREGVGGEELKKAVYASACYLYQRQEQAYNRRNLAMPSRLVYVYGAASYHMGYLSAEDLMERLLLESERPVGDTITADSVFRRLSLVPYLRYYLLKCGKESQLRLRPRVDRAVEAGFRYAQQLPMSDYFAQASNYVRNTITYTVEMDQKERADRRNAFLRWFSACHRPTYVHSLMVAWLNRTLLQRLLDVHPEIMLEPVAGVLRCKTLEEVEARQNEFLMQANEVGLYHDVGKSAVLDVVSNYGRRLTDVEFQIIQRHPYIGYWLLMRLGGMDVCAMAAFHHHRFYNGQGGYPLDITNRDENPCNLLTDILTVADSLDAGTDGVGRSYAVAKDVNALAEEFFAGRDTRYAGYVVDLFEDKEFRDSLKRQMEVIRRSTYLFAYGEEGRNNVLEFR